MKQYKFLIKFVLGRANFGIIVTDVDVVEGTGEYEGLNVILKQGVTDQEELLISDDQEVVPDTVNALDETEYMVGDDLDKMIEIYNKNSVDLYNEDWTKYFDKMKSNLNKEIDIDQ